MRSTRTLFGGVGSLLFTAGAVGSPFTYNLVLNELTPLEGSQAYGGSTQVVMANDGLIVTNSIVDGDPYVLTHQGGNTAFLTGADEGFFGFSELAYSAATSTVTFQANVAGTFSLYQSSIAGGGLATVKLDTNIVDGQFFSDSHYQVNDSGVAVFKHRTGTGSGSVQHFSTGIGATTLNTVTDPTSHGLSDFNLPNNLGHRRQAITQNGTVVFAASEGGQNGLYRLNTNGDHLLIDLPDITSQSRVIGASNNAVLYTTAPDALPTSTTSLNLQIGEDAPVTLTSYQQDTASGRALSAVMTSSNRVAYFADTFVGYYDPANGSHTVATVGQDIGGLTLAQISTHALRNSNPMVNDTGVVVFDALLTDAENESALVMALLAWDVGSQQLSVVVQADVNDPFSENNSTFGDYSVFGFLADETGFGGDVLKDALSDDNVLGLVMLYGDQDEEHVGLMTVAVPEPAGMAALLTGAGLLVRRRRRA